jgi:SAM-dependent methyltransferase
MERIGTIWTQHPGVREKFAYATTWLKQRLDPDWFNKGDFITFKEAGFVSAPSPALLLARHNYETKYIRTALSGVKAEKSLEIGCGYGRLSPTINEFSSAHVAIDINEDALKIASQCYPQIKFLAGSATALAWPDAHFDLVVTWTVLQHVPAQLIDKALAEIRRVLKPAGTLLMCEATRYPNHTPGHTWDRDPSFYDTHLLPLERVWSSDVKEIDAIPGLTTPGEVMIFRAPV